MQLVAVLILAFQFVWLNVVIPTHVRGMISYPTKTITASHDSCELPTAPWKKSKLPTPEEAARCVICHVASVHALPPTFTFDVRAGELLSTVPERPMLSVRVLHKALPYFPNGPPAPALFA